MKFSSVISFFSIITAGNSQFLECDWNGGDCFDLNFDHLSYGSYGFSFSFDSILCEENGGIVDHINDGECDSHNFKGECYFDGEDCLVHIGTSYDFELCELHVGNTNFLSDGECDIKTNNPICGFDGGDCCSCTCVDSEFKCGSTEHLYTRCIDPQAMC